MTRLLSANGFSEAALIVAQACRKNYHHLTELQTYSKQPAFESLWDCWQACKTPNWDGYEALPVEQDAYREAYQFIEALPLGYPLPSVGAEPDGHLTLDWCRHPRWTLSVSISPEGMLHYAALFGTEDPRGSCTFVGDVPDSLLFLIRKVSGL